MERIIKVTGKGKLSVKPDTTRLVLSIEGTEHEYDEALSLSSKMTGNVKSTLEKFGFERQDLKTLSFEVEAKYEGYQTKDGSWRRRFTGYGFNHRLKVEFPSDNERLGRILYALGHCKAKPEIRIEYTVSDPEAVKNKLLAKAVADSKEKAAVLTAAAGVTLGEIMNIDYSWGSIEFVTRPVEQKLMNMECCMTGGEDNSYDIDIEADDIDVTDTVTVQWAIL